MTIAKTFDDCWSADPVTGCWNWQRGKGSEGYGMLCVRRKMTRAHRFSYERTNGPIQAGMLVLHKCDNTACVNPDHLYLGTDADNTKDKVSRGRMNVKRGEQNQNAKLTVGDVERIREIYSLGSTTQQQLAEYFGIDQTNVSLIIRGKAWKVAA